MKDKIALLIIDPQNDFMGYQDGKPYKDNNGNIADLPVQGAVESMMLLSSLLTFCEEKIEEVDVIFDGHGTIHLSFATMWINKKGNPPSKYIEIPEVDINNGVWRTRNEKHLPFMKNYAHQLESLPGNRKIRIWSDIGHCVVGTWGYSVFPKLHSSLQQWSIKKMRAVEYFPKSQNPFTEHYGGLKAEVADSKDPSTLMNHRLLNKLKNFDIVLVAGVELNHCFRRTVEQIIENIGKEHYSKLHLLADCSPSLPAIPGLADFPNQGLKWLLEMEKLGVVVTTAFEMANKINS